MPGLTQADIEEIFRYHAPQPEQIAQCQRIRDAAHAFARVILDNTPPSPDQTVAVRKVREATMTANAAISLGGRY